MAELILADTSTTTTPASATTSYYSDTNTPARLMQNQDNGALYTISDLTNISTTTVSGGYAADTYLAGSNIIVNAGVWKAGTQYRCGFDMTKTAAGTAAFTVNLRIGTGGTTGDASVLALAFAVGTAAADTGWFDLLVNFRTVGAGTAAVVAGVLKCSHFLAATGLITTGASGFGAVLGTSSGFNSTTQTIIGVSVNGGTSFSGTNTFVQSQLVNI